MEKPLGPPEIIQQIEQLTVSQLAVVKLLVIHGRRISRTEFKRVLPKLGRKFTEALGGDRYPLLREALDKLEPFPWFEENSYYGGAQVLPWFRWVAMRHFFSNTADFRHLREALNPGYAHWGYNSSLEYTFNRFVDSALDRKSKAVEESLNELYRYGDTRSYLGMSPETMFLGYPYAPEFLEDFTPELLVKMLQKAQLEVIGGFLPTAYLQEIMTLADIGDRVKEEIAQLKVFQALFKGQLEAGVQLLQEHKKSLSPAAMLTFEGWIAFLQGEEATAIDLFDQAGKKLRKRGYLSEYPALLHALALLLKHDYSRVKAYADKKVDQPHLLSLVSFVALHQQNEAKAASYALRDWSHNYLVQYLDVFFFLIVATWIEEPLPPQYLGTMRKMLAEAEANDYPFFTQNLHLLIAAHGPKAETDAHRQAADNISAATGISPLLPRLQVMPAWERTLYALLQLQPTSAGAQPAESENRLIWFVNPQTKFIQPVEQKQRKNGGWTKGRNVALKRLKEEGLDCMTDQDRKILKAMKKETYGYYGQAEYYWDFAAAAYAMIGHPLLFTAESRDDGNMIPLELTERKLELVVEEKEGSYVVSLEPKVAGPGVQLIKETNTRYYLISVSQEQWEVAAALQGKLQVPKAGSERLKEAIGRLSSIMPVQSALAGDQAALPEVEATPLPHVLLLPVNDGFKAELMAKPFAIAPPYLKPGQGREILMAEVKGERVQTRRDLKLEKKLTRELVAACPVLEQVPGYQQEWQLDDPELALQLLLELEPLRLAGQVVIEWPKGQQLRLAGQAGFQQVSLRVQSQQNWFEVEGEVQVDSSTVLQLRDLLAKLAEAPDRDFVALDDGRYLALTQKLRRQLEEMRAFMNQGKEGMGLHALSASLLEDWQEAGATLEADKAWKSQMRKLKKARKVQPALPPDFQADLRPYQLEGFQWMSRLAAWGVGACLADDMGLGKTVQALALLLDRAKLGPALVVAPASVTRNWLREAERFAPSLRPYLLHEGNRSETIASLGPYDLLITSYNLLQIEIEGLAAVKFGTVVLDEAQAIKNRQTKRSKAAKSLNTSFRLITTGTPIENHLGELWNLFDFLNPGLLGSLDRFNERFANPIERQDDQEKRQQLRKLLRPFILRRRKSEVLEELPEKTEVTLNVSLSEDEMTFYEALRQEAIEKLDSEAGQPAHGGEQRMRILAEISRLRQACCHPALVRPEINLGSSKLALFGEIVEELRENGHKALVFSQFVRYLKLVEAWVQKAGIEYQYLDGQVPLKEREKRVQAFQRGEGDLFLISLKAGGTGLNLTAADYVIHLDPWWNPAVEDQASDRAHRIGQQRPVTVYRLVAEHTIEEKIVRLHTSKRELADSLLEGTDTGARLDSEALLALIRGE